MALLGGRDEALGERIGHLLVVDEHLDLVSGEQALSGSVTSWGEGSTPFMMSA
jgi:hypothetical protein